MKGYKLSYEFDFLRVGVINFCEYSSHNYPVAKTPAGFVAYVPDSKNNEVYTAAATIEKLIGSLRGLIGYEHSWKASFFPTKNWEMKQEAELTSFENQSAEC